MTPEHDGAGKDRQFAQTLAHGLDLLLAFRVGETALSNSELARRLGLSRPTVARLIHTLTVLGYLCQERDPPRYRLGAAVLGIAHPLLASMRIRPVARPLMEAFSREIGGAVSLGIRHRIHMVYVETARGSEDFENTPDIGAPLPMMSTAIGRAWLAAAPSAERRSVLNRIRVADPEGYGRDEDAALGAIAAFARDGYCSAKAAWQPNRHGFAVPIDGLVDGTRYVLNCGVSTRGGSLASLGRDIPGRLATLARSIEIMLGLR